MLKIAMDCPNEEEEGALARQFLTEDPPERILESGAVQPVVSSTDLASVRAGLRGVTVREELVDYVVSIVRKTREHDSILVGASPRAMEALLTAGRAAAALDGRDYVTPDDVKAYALPTLGHRIVLRPEYEIEGVTAAEAVERVLQDVTVPR